jgi:hypothetical protein
MRFFKDHPPVDARWETLEQPSWEDDRQAHTLPDLPEGPLSLESTVTTATQTLWMHGRPRSSPGLQGPAEIQIIERMWFKDILRIARRIQQNSRRLRPARRAKLRRCEEEVSSCYKELVALVNQDIRDLVLIIQYIGEGKSGLISKELHHCQLALTDLLTNIELVVTDSIILGEQVLIQLQRIRPRSWKTRWHLMLTTLVFLTAPFAREALAPPLPLPKTQTNKEEGGEHLL